MGSSFHPASTPASRWHDSHFTEEESEARRCELALVPQLRKCHSPGLSRQKRFHLWRKKKPVLKTRHDVANPITRSCGNFGGEGETVRPRGQEHRLWDQKDLGSESQITPPHCRMPCPALKSSARRASLSGASLDRLCPGAVLAASTEASRSRGRAALLAGDALRVGIGSRLNTCRTRH